MYTPEGLLAFIAYAVIAVLVIWLVALVLIPMSAEQSRRDEEAYARITMLRLEEQKAARRTNGDDYWSKQEFEEHS